MNKILHTSARINVHVQAQVLVEDPTEHLRVIKEALQEKEGIPVEQQRLVFGTEAQQLETFRESTKQQPAAEDLLSSLNHWQVVQSHCPCTAECPC